jgi:uncharacterized protein DUF4242
MPKFLIERRIPGAGAFSDREMRAVCQKSCAVLREMSPNIQWVHSYVTDNNIYCIYIAPDEETIREHARRSGFPVQRIARVRDIIDPSTSENPEPEPTI